MPEPGRNDEGRRTAGLRRARAGRRSVGLRDHLHRHVDHDLGVRRHRNGMLADRLTTYRSFEKEAVDKRACKVEALAEHAAKESAR